MDVKNEGGPSRRRILNAEDMRFDHLPYPVMLQREADKAGCSTASLTPSARQATREITLHAAAGEIVHLEGP